MHAKLDHYWKINPYKFDEYSKFMLNRFIPGINRLDVHVVSAWSVLVGEYSEIILETASSDLELLERSLFSKKFRELKDNLLEYVSNYKTKILVQTGQKDSYTMAFKENSIKFNQMWDIVGDKKQNYARYVENEFYPSLKELGIMVAAEWEVLIGDSPQIMCEGRVDDVNALLGNLQSKKFQKAIQELKKYIDNYKSRILSFHIQKVTGYKSVTYNMIR